MMCIEVPLGAMSGNRHCFGAQLVGIECMFSCCGVCILGRRVSDWWFPRSYTCHGSSLPSQTRRWFALCKLYLIEVGGSIIYGHLRWALPSSVVQITVIILQNKSQNFSWNVTKCNNKLKGWDVVASAWNWECWRPKLDSHGDEWRGCPPKLLLASVLLVWVTRLLGVNLFRGRLLFTKIGTDMGVIFLALSSVVDQVSSTCYHFLF